MINARKNVEPGETPDQITVSMIDQDLKDGINKAEMSIKYGIKPWEVDEMFKHPTLTGRRPSRKKTLSFKFVDDTLPLNSGDIAVEQAEEVDPNQITIDQVIEEEEDMPTFEDTMDLVKDQEMENMDEEECEIEEEDSFQL